MSQVDVKRAVLIIAKENFRDEEFFCTQKALEKAGIETVVASSVVGPCKGMLGGQGQATILVSDIAVDDFDAVVFIGGGGAMQYYDDDDALNVARQAAEKGKVIAAICIGPRILANAGLLKGVKATCYESEAEAIKKLGADFQVADVIADGKIITGNGPGAATEFGETIAQVLQAD